MSSRATLGGVVLEDVSEHRWTFTEGTSPSRGTFTLPADEAKALFEVGKEIDLIIDPNDGTKPLTVKRLFALGWEGSNHPEMARITVADIRWRWAYPVLAHGYNLTVRNGTKLIGPDGAPRQLDEAIEQFGFRRWSLRTADSGLSVWNAQEILSDILTEVNGVAPIFEDGLDAKFTSIPVEDLEQEGNADAEIQRALDFVPAAGITVDPDASVRIFDKTSGRDVIQWGRALPEDAEGGHVVMNDLRWVRPAYTDIFFPLEPELRVDFQESTGGTVAQIGDQLVMENVFPVPDHELTLATGEVVLQGTWITADQAFAAWNADTLNVLPRKLRWGHDLMQRALMPGKSLFSSLELTGDLVPNADIAARISTARQHYRQTFRLNPRWMDGILSIAANRVATIDPTSGKRGGAVVFADHCLLPSMRGMFKSIGERGRLYRAINVSGLASTSTPLGQGTEQAPAEVSVLDPDQGIFRIEYKQDIYKQVAAILPSKVTGLPTGDIIRRGVQILWNAVEPGVDPPRLSSGFICTVLLSATPAGPNNKNRFFRVRMTAEELGQKNAKGPPMEIIYRGETARVPWVDSKSDLIKRIFGIGFVKGDAPPELRDIVINYEPGGAKASGAAALSVLARAIAAQTYATFADGPVGEMTHWNLNADIRLEGRVASVTHAINPDGKATTSLSFDVARVKPSLFELLDPHSKRVINRSRVPV